jgi:hypothetical protein
LLDSQQEIRAELRWRQDAGLDNAPFFLEFEERKLASQEIQTGFHETGRELTGRDQAAGFQASTPEPDRNGDEVYVYPPFNIVDATLYQALQGLLARMTSRLRAAQ